MDEKVEVEMLRGDSLVIRDESLASLPVHKEWPMWRWRSLSLFATLSPMSTSCSLTCHSVPSVCQRVSLHQASLCPDRCIVRLSRCCCQLRTLCLPPFPKYFSLMALSLWLFLCCCCCLRSSSPPTPCNHWKDNTCSVTWPWPHREDWGGLRAGSWTAHQGSPSRTGPPTLVLKHRSSDTLCSLPIA